MKKNLFITFLVLALFCLSSCSSIKILADGIKDAENITSENEYYIGRSVSAAILEKYSLYTKAPKTTQYLNQICRTLTINSDIPYIYNDYYIGIIDTDEINALSTPGGHIFISRGLISCADSEDALAAIVAHEVAHIQLHHSIDAIKASKYVGAFSDFGKDVYDKATADIDTLDEKMKLDVKNFMDYTSDMLSTLVDTGFSQSSEFDADILALKLMSNSGYDPNAMISMLEKINISAKSDKNTGWGKTHPSPQDRINNVKGMIKKIDFSGSDKSVRQARFEKNKI